jgi:hypothetical protein
MASATCWCAPRLSDQQRALAIGTAAVVARAIRRHLGLSDGFGSVRAVELAVFGPRATQASFNEVVQKVAALSSNPAVIQMSGAKYASSMSQTAKARDRHLAGVNAAHKSRLDSMSADDRAQSLERVAYRLELASRPERKKFSRCASLAHLPPAELALRIYRILSHEQYFSIRNITDLELLTQTSSSQLPSITARNGYDVDAVLAAVLANQLVISPETGKWAEALRLGPGAIATQLKEIMLPVDFKKVTCTQSFLAIKTNRKLKKEPPRLTKPYSEVPSGNHSNRDQTKWNGWPITDIVKEMVALHGASPNEKKLTFFFGLR